MKAPPNLLFPLTRAAKSSKPQPPIFPSHLTTTAASRFSLSPSDVEVTLKLFYASPVSALKFFIWYSSLVHPTSYAWNHVIDILGKNALFFPMWDVIHSMHSQYLISLATIASVFSSCSAAGSFSNALQTFDWMEDCFGIKTDVATLNTLLSALCREGHTRVARDFLKTRKHKLMPDVDIYTILMEGWENKGDGRRALQAFVEMVERFLGLERGGW